MSNLGAGPSKKKILGSWTYNTVGTDLLIKNPTNSVSLNTAFSFLTNTTIQSIVSGNSGSSGGEPGATGVRGATGPIGSPGMPRSNGPTGPTGVSGDTGAAGPTGVAGATGVAGDTGIVSAPGMTGPSGATGEIGLSGETGIRGAPGLPGTNGANGNPGTTGQFGGEHTGSQGPTGVSVIGTQGPPGATISLGAGLVGPTGPTGVIGPSRLPLIINNVVPIPMFNVSQAIHVYNNNLYSPPINTKYIRITVIGKGGNGAYLNAVMNLLTGGGGGGVVIFTTPYIVGENIQCLISDTVGDNQYFCTVRYSNILAAAGYGSNGGDGVGGIGGSCYCSLGSAILLPGQSSIDRNGANSGLGSGGGIFRQGANNISQFGGGSFSALANDPSDPTPILNGGIPAIIIEYMI
jgi:hypothetical protein